MLRTNDAQIAHADDVNAIAISEDGRRAVTGSYDRSIIVWDARTGAPLRIFEGHYSSVTGVAINSNGTQILSCSSDRTVRLWGVDDGTELLKLEGHKREVTCVAFCGQDLAVSGSLDSTLKVWDLTNGRECCTFEGHHQEDKGSEYRGSPFVAWGVTSVALLHHQDVVASGDMSGRLILWELRSGRERMRVECYADQVEPTDTTKFKFEPARGPGWPPPRVAVGSVAVGSSVIYCLTVTPDDRFLAIAQANRPITMWDIQEKREHLTLSGHIGTVFSVAVTPDGQRLVSAGDDHTLRFWDLTKGTCICIFTADSPLYSCAVHPDGRTIIAGEGARSGRVLFLRSIFPGDAK